MRYNAVLDVLFTDDEPVVEPVTLEQVKQHCRIDLDDDDALINLYIKAARQQCEGFLNISLIKRTVSAQLLNEVGGIFLPYGPVGNILDTTTDGSAYSVFSSLKRFQYTGVGGELIISQPKDLDGNTISLTGKKVLSFEKDGIAFSKQIATGTPVDKQFKYTQSTGLIEVGIPFEAGEEASGLYIDSETEGGSAGTTVDDINISSGLFKRVLTASCEELTIVYEAGYNVVPSNLVDGILCQVAWLYESRGDAELRNGLCEQAKLLLNPYRRVL
jgi:hypothetical protein